MEAEALKIWNHYKIISKEKRQKSDNDNLTDADGEEILKLFQDVYKNFAEMFPIVLRYICQMGQFNSKAFSKYLRKVKNSTDRERKTHMVDRNADYVKYLWQESNKNHPRWAQESAYVYRTAYKSLNDEFETYEAAQELAKERIKEMDEKNLQSKRDDLKKFIR